MREISSYKTLEELDSAFGEWVATNLTGDSWQLHAGNAAKPIPKESMHWRSHMIECADALAWANDLRPDAEDYETQALALASVDCKVAVAQGKCHRYIRAHKFLKRMAETADRKLSCLQSLCRN